jgi:hypothetical protein
MCTGGRIRILCVPRNRISVGDIIVFRENRRLIAHRLLMRIPIGKASLVYQKGDAMDLGKWISGNRIIGIVTTAWDFSENQVYLRDNEKEKLEGIALRHLFRVLGYPVIRLASALRRLAGCL